MTPKQMELLLLRVGSILSFVHEVADANHRRDVWQTLLFAGVSVLVLFQLVRISALLREVARLLEAMQ